MATVLADMSMSLVGVPVWIPTHDPPDGWDDAPFTLVTEGVEAAVKQASEHAGDGIVGVAGASVVRQCLNAGILDAVRVSLVPYLIGEGGSLLRRPGGDSGEAVAAEGGRGQARHPPHFEVER
jgi:dihydrofolate reductase